MIWTVTEEQLLDNNAKKHAGGKAREDLRSIFLDIGFTELKIECPQIERARSRFIKKVAYHFSIEREWETLIEELATGDTLILQFPVFNHTLLLNRAIKKAKRKGVKLYAFIHDLNCLRLSSDSSFSLAERMRMKKEEIDELHEFDSIVVHNNAMKKYMISNLGIDSTRMVSIELFDYLVNDTFIPFNETDDHNKCIIAGNLMRNKAGYVYKLPNSPEFELFGVNFDEDGLKNNIHHNGSFLPEELPKHLKGGYGLVWDGDSADTCTGSWGEYLRYNNPHKVSLYLACGIPVIIWEEAALANFVKEHNVGITVKSLHEIDEALAGVTQGQYETLKRNAIELSDKLRNGHFTKAALRQLSLI